METSTTSPLKAWVKKHSPIKSRNKPLPAAPREDADSPTKSRSPMRAISTNVSPSKEKGTKRKISGFIRGKPASNEDVPPVPTTKHRRISSVPGKQPLHPSQPYMQGSNESDKQLADRVELLEAELKAARAELASNTNGTTKQKLPSMPPSTRSRPSLGRRSHSVEIHSSRDEDALVRQERLMRGHRYDGLVESLLEQDYDAANATAASFASQTGATTTRQDSRKSGRRSALASYGDMESRYMDDEENDEEHLKRKRSELRAAEWKRIQENYDSRVHQSPSGASKRGHEESNTLNDERPARRQKQSHESNSKDSTTTTNPRNRRAASEGNATSDLEIKRSGVIRQVPIQTQPYKIEYVHMKSNTNDETQPVRPAKTPPKGRPTYDLMKAFESNTPKTKSKDNENVEVFNEGENEPEEPDAEPKLTSPHRRNIPSPSRLQTVREEFEWDDEVF